MDFSKQIAKTKLYENLKAQSRAGKFFHANLFFCPDKLTNLQFCLLVAKMLVCQSQSACGVCGSCVKVEKETNPDVMSFGEKTKFTVADVEKILENQTLKPMISPCKVYLINNINNATVQAQNKLLKVLEEPNRDVFFIINATTLVNVLPTIKSRCKIITIPPFEFEQMKEMFLDKPWEISPILHSQSGGYVGRLIELAGDGEFAQDLALAQQIVFDMKNSKQVLFYSSKLSCSKAAFMTKLGLIQNLYRDLLMIFLDQPIQDLNIQQRLKQIKDEFSLQALLEILQRIDFCKKQFDANVNLAMIADGLLMKILEVKYLCKQK